MTVAEIMSWLFLGRRPPKPKPLTIEEQRARAYDSGADKLEKEGHNLARDGNFNLAESSFARADKMRHLAEEQRARKTRGKTADSIIIDDPCAPWRAEEKTEGTDNE